MSAFWRVKQEDHEFEANLGYIGRPYFSGGVFLFLFFNNKPTKHVGEIK